MLVVGNDVGWQCIVMSLMFGIPIAGYEQDEEQFLASTQFVEKHAVTLH